MRLAVVPIPGTRPEGVLFSAHELPRLLEVARLAEAVGVPDLGLSEHVLMAYNSASYPFGRYPHTTAEPFPEPMMTLCAMAAVTSRIRLLMSKGRSQDVALDEELPGLQQAGVTHLRVQLSMFVEHFDEIEPFLERLMLRPWTLD